MKTLLKSAVVLLALALLPVFAAEKKKQEPRPDLPVEEWLHGPDRSDIKWKVEVLKPRLTFQQRYLIEVQANVDAEPLEDGNPHDLYFLLKLADDKGRWLPDETHNHFPVPQGVARNSELQYTAGFYAKPGHYTVAILLFDYANGRGNVVRKNVEVKAPSHDPLPALDRDLPAVELLEDVPDQVETRSSFRVGRIPFSTTERWRGTELWTPGHGKEWLPVHNPRPLSVDIVLNFSPWIDPDLARITPAVAYRIANGRMLQIGALLSHLHLDRGCVHISGVDLSRMETVFERIDAREADWEQLTEKAQKLDHNTVSVGVLRSKSAALFLRDTLSGLMTDSAGCGPGSGTVEHAIVLVSHGFEFPAGTRGDRLWPDAQCACRYYHIRIHSSPADDLERFLKPANPRRFDVTSPEQFRKVLAELIEELSGGRERAREAAQ